MGFFDNIFFRVPGQSEKPDKKLTPDEEIAEYFESSRRFESGNLERVKSEGVLNQRQKHDDYRFVQEKLLKLVNSFIDNLPEFTDEQKEAQRKKFQHALKLAMDIHADQKPRPDGPYVNHLLRVGMKVVEEYGIEDVDCVVAALLHDSVEDQSAKLSKLSGNSNNLSEKEKALLFINDNFGSKVRNTVFKLTNLEHEDRDIPQDRKNQVYLEHVAEAIEDADVFPVKLADFSDNALTLDLVKDDERRLKLSRKYLPVIGIFVKRLEKAQDIFSPEKIAIIREALLSAEVNLKDFIDNQEQADKESR